MKPFAPAELEARLTALITRVDELLPTDIQTFTAAGAFTWTMPTGWTEAYLDEIIIGAGGGGGGGGAPGFF